MPGKIDLPPGLREAIDRGTSRPRQRAVARVPAVVVRSLIHDIDLDAYSLELRFWKVDGIRNSLTIPRSLTASPQHVVLHLLDAGALLPSDRKAAVELVQRSFLEPAAISRAVTRRGGWHGSSYVTSTGTIGPQAGHLSFIPPNDFKDESIGLRLGSLEGWREGMREACASSSFLVFALGLGYGGPLLDVLNEDEGAIFNFFGRSSGGKTFAARCIHSQAGRPRKADLATYDITLRATEELCFARRDWVVVIDEVSRAKGSPEQRREKIRNLAFMIPSGRGQIRSAKVGGIHDLPNLSWRVLGLTSGEKPLEDQGTRRVAGEQLRHIDIRVPNTQMGGIFDLVDGEGDDLGRETARLAAALEATIAAHYGFARDRYLERLTWERGAVAARVARMVDEFVEAVGASTQPWERRLARKFGIVAAGAMLAAEWDVAPFSVDHARRCIHHVYRTARRSIFSVEDETMDVLNAVRGGMEAGRFPRLPKGTPLPAAMVEEAWGFRRETDGREIVAILPSVFVAQASSEPSAIAVLDTLIEQGVALAGPDGKRHRQIAVQGFPRNGRGRWVCLLTKRLM